MDLGAYARRRKIHSASWRTSLLSSVVVGCASIRSFRRRIEEAHHWGLRWRRSHLLFFERLSLGRLPLGSSVADGLLLFLEFFAGGLFRFFPLALDLREIIAQRHLPGHKLLEMARQVTIQLFGCPGTAEWCEQRRSLAVFHSFRHHGNRQVLIIDLRNDDHQSPICEQRHQLHKETGRGCCRWCAHKLLSLRVCR